MEAQINQRGLAPIIAKNGSSSDVAFIPILIGSPKFKKLLKPNSHFSDFFPFKIPGFALIWQKICY